MSKSFPELSGLTLSSRCFYVRARTRPPPPLSFSSDLDSGPKDGGENNNGAYVTIYGSNLDSNPTVTVGSGQVLVKMAPSPYLGYQKMTIQLGPNAQSGNIVVGNSNGIPFTVRPGNIYFVATTGSDANSGGFASPWKTLLHARDAIAAGDIVYARNGVAQSGDDGSGWSACMLIAASSGSAGNPKALVVYPGETATIGNVLGNSQGGCDNAIRTKGQGENYWTIAGFTIRGGAIAVATFGDKAMRIIGNDMSCPNGNGQAGCLDIDETDSFYVYGNNIHHVGTNLNPGSVTALYHGVYISEQAAHVWFGWNTIAYVQGCRGLQQNVNTGNGVYDLHVFSNIIHDTQCDGIVGTVMDPSQGVVEYYNNVIYNAGLGPANLENSGGWNCINLQGWDAGGGTPGSGTVDIYNNTMWNCGTFANPPYAGSSGGFLWEDGNSTAKHARFRNNIVYMTVNQPYMNVYTSQQGASCSANCVQVQGANNLFFGNGTSPSNNQLTASINKDPLFTNASGANFALQPGSPALGAGVNTGICANGSSWNIGACSASAASGTGTPPSACDINGDGAVNVNDVQLEINQALHRVACTNDIDKDGACTVVDVQRVVNAALGGPCVSP